jgi:hypothetical protein
MKYSLNPLDFEEFRLYLFHFGLPGPALIAELGCQGQDRIASAALFSINT